MAGLRCARDGRLVPRPADTSRRAGVTHEMREGDCEMGAWSVLTPLHQPVGSDGASDIIEHALDPARRALLMAHPVGTASSSSHIRGVSHRGGAGAPEGGNSRDGSCQSRTGSSR